MLMYLSCFLHPHTKHKSMYYALRKTGVDLCREWNSPCNFTESHCVVHQTWNGKGKLNLFLCSTKHRSSKVYCEVGGNDPCTLNLDTWWNWLFSFVPRPLCSQESFQGFGGKKNPSLAIERWFFGHPSHSLLTIAAKLSDKESLWNDCPPSHTQSYQRQGKLSKRRL